MTQQDVFWLQVTVNDLLLLQEVKRTEHLLREAPDQLETMATELVRLDELVKVHIEELGGDAKMSTEIETVREINHAMPVFRILFDIR